MESKTQWMSELHNAIYHLDIRAVKNALANGAMISNDNNKTHTLNRCIHASFSVHPNKFNLSFIEEIINLGALPCNSDGKLHYDKNSLTQTLNIAHETKYKREKFVAMQNNIIMVIKLLLRNGALPNNEDNWNNSLLCAVKTMNPEILKCVVIRGGKPPNNQCMFKQFINEFKNSVGGDQLIDRMMCLIMCSGARPAIDSINLKILGNDYMSRDDRQYIKIKVITSYELLNPYNIVFKNRHTKRKFEERIDDLRKELKTTMKELFKERRISEIDLVIKNYFPECLFDIIYDYYTEHFVEFIDWENVGRIDKKTQ